MNGAEVPPVDTETVLQLKRELCGIRNKVNALLEVLDTARVADTLPTTTHPSAPEETDKKQLLGTQIGLGSSCISSFVCMHGSWCIGVPSSLLPRSVHNTLYSTLVHPLALPALPATHYSPLSTQCQKS